MPDNNSTSSSRGRGSPENATIAADDIEDRRRIADKNRNSRVSVSNEDNVLLDPEVLTDFPTQALVLTILATLVRNTTDELEMRILYEYLAEASVVFPKVFPVIHSLLDAKITSVLSLCHDQVILSAVQSIIQNMIACEDAQQQPHYLQTFGFGGLWRFAGPFSKSYQSNLDNAELFVNCLEAMVETCLPVDDGEVRELEYPSTLSVSSTMNLSSSMSSLTLGSPTDKEMNAMNAMNATEYHSTNSVSSGAANCETKRNGASNQHPFIKQRSFKCKASKNGSK